MCVMPTRTRVPKFFAELAAGLRARFDPAHPDFERFSGPHVSFSLGAGATVADMVKACGLDPASFELSAEPFARGYSFFGYAREALAEFGLEYPAPPLAPPAPAAQPTPKQITAAREYVADCASNGANPNMDRAVQYIIAKCPGAGQQRAREAFRIATYHKGKRGRPPKNKQ